MSSEYIEKIMNTTDEDIAKMTFKEKQKFFKAKSNIVSVFFKNSKTRPKTYKKEKKV